MSTPSFKPRSRFLFPAVLMVLAVLGGVAGYSLMRFAGPSAETPPRAGTVAHFIPTEPAQPIQDFAFVTEDGKRLTFADLRGKVVLVNLWATWCPPCVREMPSLDRLQQALGGADFEVVALQTMDPRGLGAVPAFYRRIGVTALRVYGDPDAQATRALGVPGLPATLLLDAEGRERGRLLGAAEWDAPEAQELIRFFLRETEDAS